MANGEIYEKNLSNASGIGSGDYLRTVNSNNESEKINYTLLAKAIIEQWTGSSLAGSAQSVKSAVDTLNNKTFSVLSPTTEISSGADLNNYTTTGSYKTPNGATTATLLNCPYSSSGIKLIVENLSASSQIMQTIRCANAGYIYFRVYSGGAWKEWVRIATGAEIDSLNTATTGSGALATQSSWTMLAYSYVRLAKMAFVKIEATSTNTSTSWVTVATGYPAPQRAYYYQIATPQGVCKARLNTSGELALANSQGVNGCKIDTVFSYPLV